ncbi:MAG: virulence RhuM family protein [Ignavibacteriaceae bacterium]|nr:virulence RhuM family protein [Ignavibacteriaceae bacterium]
MSEIVIYKSPENQAQVEVTFEGETFWLSLNQISSLFGRDKSVISRHLKNIFSSGELDKNSVVAKNATTASDGKTYEVEYYNLDAIISVGYRVNSVRGTQFRQWATQRLREYLVSGYAINEKRLAEKQQQVEYLKSGIRILRAVPLASRHLLRIAIYFPFLQKDLLCLMITITNNLILKGRRSERLFTRMLGSI